jgi:DNA invertase Pin-like site-specific DNA recombinase
MDDISSTMTTSPHAPTPVAQYLRMSTERQEYSLYNQAAAIERYAQQNGFTVIKTYADSGKSGLVLNHREGLAQLLHDVVGTEQPYRAVLVYDVSRWGRFMDTDESAYYEFHCKKAGVPVHYCAETFANDGTMPSLVMKALKRVMASEYSRELSQKVFEGMRGMVQRGLWAGSIPGYGLRRMLVSSDGKPKQIMKYGERKNLRSDHTILVPGPSRETKWIREIYRMFIEEKRSSVYIAEVLNRKNVRNGTSLWNNQSVLKILTHEKYTGSLVWGRWTQKLRTRLIPVAREHWTILPGALKPIIDRKTFDAAQKILDERTANQSDAVLLNRVRSLLARKKRLTARLLNESRTAPSAVCCKHRFGSLRHLYELLNYRRSDTVQKRQKTRLQIGNLQIALFSRLKKMFSDLRAVRERTSTKPKTLRFSTGLTVTVAVCLSERTALGSLRWRFQAVSARRRGLPTLLCLCNTTNTGFRDFHVMPSVSHIRIVSLLKRDDIRLATGVRLKSLSDFRRVVHSVSAASQSPTATSGSRPPRR